MSNSYNPYTYKTDKEIEEHLGFDLFDMTIQIEKIGYVVQEQFKKLDAYLSENYANDIARILNKRVNNADIIYGFSKYSCFFVYYDRNKITTEEALKKADEFYVDSYIN